MLPRTIEIRTCIIVCLGLVILQLVGMYLFIKLNRPVKTVIQPPVHQPVVIPQNTVLPAPSARVAENSSSLKPFVIPVENGVWRTVDPGGSGGTLSHVMHPVNGTILVFSDMSRSLLRSQDGTRTYQAIAPEGHPTLTPIVPHPAKAGVWYAGYSLDDEQGLAQSVDDGETWVLINHEPGAVGSNAFGLVMDTRPETIVWDFGSKGLMVSRDQGKTFADFNQGLSLENLYGQYQETSGKIPITAIERNSGVMIYLACKKGIFKRDLAASQWEAIETLPEKKAISLAYDSGKDWIWAGFENGEIYIGDLMAGKWERAVTGPPDATIMRTHPLRPGWVWSFSHGRAGLFVSKDKGKTWESLTRFLLFDNPDYTGNVPSSFRDRNKVIRDFFSIDPENPDTLYLGQVYVSYDGGDTWEFGATEYLPEQQAWHGNGLTLLTSYKAWWDQVNPNRVYLGFSDTGLMRSDDRGYSVQALWKEKFPDLYPLAYWKNQMLDTSGSCMAFAVDPQFPQTMYYGMSNKGNSPNTSGMLFRSMHGDSFWKPVIPNKTTLPNGIITDLILQPGNGFTDRKLYALVNYKTTDNISESGIFLSTDNGESFNRLAGSGDSVLTFPLLDLDYCKDHPDVMYMVSSTRGGKRPAKRIRKTYDHTGGVFKSLDAGLTWIKTGGEELAGAVEVAVHPNNPDVAYTAVVPGKGDIKIDSATGVHKTMDGGNTWKMVLSAQEWLPEKRKSENGEPVSVAINPELPDIIYAVIKYAGVLRSTNAGSAWERVDWENLKKYQGNYHTLTINPHDPAEFYLSLFGNSFLAYRDPVADAMLTHASVGKNLIRNGDFERTDRSGKPVHWVWNNLNHPDPEGTPILSIENSPERIGRSLHVRMGEGTYSNNSFTGKNALPITWLENQINPYSITLARGKQINLRYEIYATTAKFRDLPVLSLVETKKTGSEVKAELPAVMGYSATPYRRFRIDPGQNEAGKWVLVESSVHISEDVNSIKLVLFTSQENEITDFFIDNIVLEIR
jgi:hypothetical protein